MQRFAHFRYAAHTDIGKKRTNNEDAFGVFPDYGIFCVSDGMGGGDDGEVASAATIKAVDAFCAAHPFPKGATYAIEGIVEGLCAAINSASAWICARAKEKNLRGCGATFVAILFDAAKPSTAIALHAGDSRLYRVRARKIQQITTDHSAAELIGVKNEKDINPMFRGMILRAVGIQPCVDIEATPVLIKEGDRFVVCSDGLSKMVPDKKMLSIVRSSTSPEDAVKNLIAAANEAGGVDNITVVVVDVGPLPAPMLAKSIVFTSIKDKNSKPGFSSGVLHADSDSDSGAEFSTWDGSAEEDSATVTNTLSTWSSVGSASSTSAGAILGAETADAVVLPDTPAPGIATPGAAPATASIPAKWKWMAIGAVISLICTVTTWILIGHLRDIAEEKRQSEVAEAERLAKVSVELKAKEDAVARTQIPDAKIEEDRIAREKAEKERIADEKAEIERQRVAAMSDVTNKVWKLLAQVVPVAERSKRIREADAIYRQASRSNMLDRAVDDMIFNAIQDRRHWVVGSVSNKCCEEVMIDGRCVESGSVAVFVFTNGVPHRWEALRKGYEPLALETKFDGMELTIDEGAFRRSEVEVAVPEISGEVELLIDGETPKIPVRRRPGARISYSYRRRGYEYVGPKIYEVKDAPAQAFPTPGDADWKVLSVVVSVPVQDGMECFVDGKAIAGGTGVNAVPGTELVYTYRRKGYRDITRRYKVVMADYQKLPQPAISEWMHNPAPSMVPVPKADRVLADDALVELYTASAKVHASEFLTWAKKLAADSSKKNMAIKKLNALFAEMSLSATPTETRRKNALEITESVQILVEGIRQNVDLEINDVETSRDDADRAGNREKVQYFQAQLERRNRFLSDAKILLALQPDNPVAQRKAAEIISMMPVYFK